MSTAKQNITTPKGELRWAYITTPRKNLNGQDEFSVQVVVPRKEAQTLVDEIDTFWDENKPKGAKAAKSLGYRIDDETDSVLFTLKTKTTYADGKPKDVRVFNNKAKQITVPEGTRIGNGSRGRVSGVMAVYDAGQAARGVTLFLDAIQLTKFVEYKGGANAFAADEDDGDDFAGFSSVEEAPFLADSEL